MPRRRIREENNRNASAASITRDPSRNVRCAIYTRKSTSEGLDKAFNSLDAQREACEAYIVSQKTLGWQIMPTRYDDGGFTGGNIERPAVQHLLEDVQKGLVDCVVVYKVDRLSRSLLDFARIIKLFEDHQVHFVSVTQHFNTADSMGRLTLNILLSFAQFEREIIAERTRDKIAAARRRGQWAGGRPILGYDLQPGAHRLTINPQEAEQIRAIFRLYLEKESVLTTAQALNSRGWGTKRWTAANGNVIGGRPFNRANLHHLLTNVAYIGRVRHRQETHPGQHEAIVDQAIWDKVQRLLRRNARTAGSFLRNKHGSLLKGILRCKACDAAMIQMVSRRGPKLHRYYACTKAQKGGYKHCPIGTILGGPLEREVGAQLRRLAEEVKLNGERRTIELTGDEAASAPREIDEFIHGDWENMLPLERARLIRFIVETVEYDGSTQKVSVKLTDEAAQRLLGATNGSSTTHSEFPVTGLKPMKNRRVECSRLAKPISAVARSIVLAYQIEQAIRDGRARDYAEVAKQLQLTRARVSQIMGLLRLPPATIESLLVSDASSGPRLTERQLRPLIAGSASSR